MPHKSHWYIGDRRAPRDPRDDIPPNADAIYIMDCEDPNCHSVHIILVDVKNDIGLAQATVSLDMVKDMLRIILGKAGIPYD